MKAYLLLQLQLLVLLLLPTVAVAAASLLLPFNVASAAFVAAADGQLDVCGTDAAHPLEEILDGIDDPWLYENPKPSTLGL